MIREIKGLLGLCQAKGCWHKALGEATFSGIDVDGQRVQIGKKTLLCADCLLKVTKGKPMSISQEGHT